MEKSAFARENYISLVKGIDRFIEEDVEEARKTANLWMLLKEIYDRNGRSWKFIWKRKMFFLQGSKICERMKKAVAYLQPFIEAEKILQDQKSQRKSIDGDCKGDVHDIGKNIVSVVLGCNNYEIVDLGVMVPAEKIIQTAIDEKVDVIGLSGFNYKV